MNYSFAFKSFFGTASSSFNSRVLLTNISPFFESIINESTVLESFSGFYLVKNIELFTNTPFTIIKVNQGSTIIDVLTLLKNICSEMVFIGIAGSLNESLPVGKIIAPTLFLNKCEHVNKNTDDITIFQTDGIINNDDYYHRLKKLNVDLVDMESRYVNSFCTDNNIDLKYFIQVSDLPLSKPFYSVPSLPLNTQALKGVL